MMLEVPVRPLHVLGIDPRHPRKVPTHVGTLISQAEGSAFCLPSLANAKSSHTKPVTNTKFFWKAIFGVRPKTLIPYPLFVMQVDGMKRQELEGLQEMACLKYPCN